MSCDVTLDKGHFGPKYVLGYTILDFTTKPLMQWEKDNPGDEVYVKKMFDLFRIFLLRLAANTWDLCAAKFEAHREKLHEMHDGLPGGSFQVHQPQQPNSFAGFVLRASLDT